MRWISALTGLPKTVWLIGLISLVNDSASEMLYPLIPLYLASVLMAGPKALGLIEGIAEATASLLKLFSGIIVDRTQRSKPWLLVGYGLAGFGRPLIAFISSWPWLLVIRFADRMGKGLRTSPRDALLAASVNAESRGLAFGVHRAMDNAGAVIGPLLAALMLGMGLGLKTLFMWAWIPALLCVGLTLMIKEPKITHQPKDFKWVWHPGDMPTAFKRYLVVVAIFTLGNSSNMFLLLRAKELGVPQTQIPLLWAAVSVVAMIFSAPLSALSDRFGRVKLLIAGYVAYALVYFILGFLTTDGIGLFVIFACYGIFLAATEGVEKAFVADLAPVDKRGSAFGWFNLTAGVLLLPASILFGWIYQGASPFLAFSFSAACALMAAFLLKYWVQDTE